MQKTVLVVEDEVLIAMDMQATLECLGWIVMGPTPTVKGALGLMDRELPAVAILDMNLGRELVTPVAEALRDRDVPFLIASACVDPVALGGAVFEGVTNIGKPFNERGIATALAALDLPDLS
jgi:two-component system, response regulator PdtaR